MVSKATIVSCALINLPGTRSINRQNAIADNVFIVALLAQSFLSFKDTIFPGIYTLNALLPFFLSTCGLLDKTEKCGETVNNDLELYQYSLFKDSSLYSMQFQYNSSSQQTTISFSSIIYENVCTEEHATVDVKILIDKDYTEIVPKARVDWYPLFGSEIALTLDRSNILVYDGSYEIGLKQVYKDQPGRFYISWSLTFPSQKDRRSDLIWLNNRVLAIHIDSHYKLHL